MRPVMLIGLFFLLAAAPQGGCHLSFPDQARLEPPKLSASFGSDASENSLPGMGCLLLT
ncbi:hypothetical protein [Geomesophilobacter sediminis]|uniref:Uncharacterized protein n=1 Tax=Geomesophilobacter sediminis TaxID=2798584 RepID=A0A8J7S7T9_9BACT|nr:hypothetical protein [Geomesophilobacter sediminis]MBJ6727132.1 hypothetical protein [Geomesophilobacter sediminis]